MKKILFIFTVLSAVVCQNLGYSATTSSESFETEVESFLSDLSLAKTNAERARIKKGFFSKLKNQAEKQIKKLEKQLANLAEKLQKTKDKDEAKQLRSKMSSLKDKINKLKDSLTGSSSSS